MGGGDEMPERMSEDELQRAINDKAENRDRDDWMGIAKEAWSHFSELQAEAAAMREALDRLPLFAKDPLTGTHICPSCFVSIDCEGHEGNCKLQAALAPDAGKDILEKLKRFDELVAYVKKVTKDPVVEIKNPEPPRWIND